VKFFVPSTRCSPFMIGAVNNFLSSSGEAHLILCVAQLEAVDHSFVDRAGN